MIIILYSVIFLTRPVQYTPINISVPYSQLELEVRHGTESKESKQVRC